MPLPPPPNPVPDTGRTYFCAHCRGETTSNHIPHGWISAMISNGPLTGGTRLGLFCSMTCLSSWSTSKQTERRFSREPLARQLASLASV